MVNSSREPGSRSASRFTLIAKALTDDGKHEPHGRIVALIIIPVRINHKGPFDFMVETGSQVTVADPSLASELDLKPQGSVGLVSVANYAKASIAVLGTLEAGSHTVDKPFVLVKELAQIRAADPRIRGVLGENFLAHFDLLIDYRRKVVCLDATKALAGFVHGEHIPLVAPSTLRVNCPIWSAW